MMVMGKGKAKRSMRSTVPPLGRHLIHKLVRERVGFGAHPLDHAGREGFVDEGAQPRVVGRV